MRRFARGDLLWSAGLVALLLLGYGVLPSPRVRQPIDTFSEDGSGKLAFYLLTESLLGPVGRSTDSLVPDDPAVDTLVMLGPARYPDRAQWQTLYDWVSEGHALVFAARHADPAIRLEPFGIEVAPASSRDEALDQSAFDASRDGPLLSGVEPSGTRWQTAGHVVSASPDAEVALSLDGDAQVVWRFVGDGVVVVAASDRVFTNRALVRGDHGLLAFRILESAGPAGPVYFDETMNRAGAPQVVGVLLEPPLRLVTLQALVLALLFGWMASRRFGPLERDATAPRRSLVEHAAALGSLHFAAGDGSRLLSSYVEFFRRELAAAGRETAVSRDSNDRRPESDQEVLERALRAAGRRPLPRAQAARVLTRLARLMNRGPTRT